MKKINKKVWIVVKWGIVGLLLCIWGFMCFNGKMGSHKEIERKWVIDPDALKYDLSQVDYILIEQTYLSFEPEVRVRSIDNGRQYIMTKKEHMDETGLMRDETEYDITKETYEDLLKDKKGMTIFKKRYMVEEDGIEHFIDIFMGDLEGLAYMEIEFENEEAARNYKTPDWVIRDVTDDIRYKNASLAQYGLPEEFKAYSR